MTENQKSPWIAVSVKLYAQTEGSKHFATRDRRFAMKREDFDRLSFGEILDGDLHYVVDSAPIWDTKQD